jgi:hypothetical protein
MCLAAMLSLPALLRAGETAEAPAPNGTNDALTASINLVGGPGLSPTYIANVNFGTNKFGFAMPDGFRLSNTEARKLTLVSADFNSIINWQVIGPAPTNGAQLDPAEYRALVLRRHPEAKNLSEFSLCAGGQRGPAFEMQWSGQGGLERTELSVFIITPAGVVEFNLVSSHEKYGTARQKMNTAMLTLRWADEHGKLEMPVFSNRL